MNRTSNGVMWLGVALVASGVVLSGVDLYVQLAARNVPTPDWVLGLHSIGFATIVLGLAIIAVPLWRSGAFDGAGSGQEFRLLVNGVTDYAIFMLDPQGIITTWNAGA